MQEIHPSVHNPPSSDKPSSSMIKVLTDMKIHGLLEHPKPISLNSKELIQAIFTHSSSMIFKSASQDHQAGPSKKHPSWEVWTNSTIWSTSIPLKLSRSKIPLEHPTSISSPCSLQTNLFPCIQSSIPQPQIQYRKYTHFRQDITVSNTAIQL